MRPCKKLARMTDHSRTLTSLEAPGNAGMMMPVLMMPVLMMPVLMMPVRAVACCRMCA